MVIHCDRYPVLKQVKTSQIACLLIALLPIAEGLPQGASNFDLFERIENSDPSLDRPGRQSRQATSNRSPAEPTFTLIGTTRIGVNAAVILRHSSGGQVRVEYTGSPTRISGYEGFYVSDVTSRSVSIRHPSNSPCVTIEDEGVDCDPGANTSHISLTTASPVSAESEPLRDALELPDEPPQENSANPFESIRRSADNRAPSPSQGDSQRFRPRRIDPADVPPGMRVVSTPFGDRLVEN